MKTHDRPEIRAEFVLDEQGRPEAINEGGREHFRIRLTVDGVPEDTHAVTYELDPTYYDPIREVRSGVPAFEEEITSYGDYEVKARIRRKSRNEMVTANLSDALSRTYDEGAPELAATPDVAAALWKIRRF